MITDRCWTTASHLIPHVSISCHNLHVRKLLCTSQFPHNKVTGLYFWPRSYTIIYRTWAQISKACKKLWQLVSPISQHDSWMLANYLQIVITLAIMFRQVRQHLPNTESVNWHFISVQSELARDWKWLLLMCITLGEKKGTFNWV